MEAKPSISTTDDVQRIDAVSALSPAEFRSLLLRDYERELLNSVRTQGDVRFRASFFCMKKSTAAQRSARVQAFIERQLTRRQSDRVDFAYWAKAAYWSIEEACLLLSGIEPSASLRPEEDIEPLADELPSAATYRDLRRLLLRECNGSDSVRVIPRDVLNWTKKFDLVVPDGLADAVARYGRDEQADNPDGKQVRKIRSDREQNLLRVIAGLWALSDLSAEQNTVADKLSALFDTWRWDKPAKSTMADTILKEAANLPGAEIRK